MRSPWFWMGVAGCLAGSAWAARLPVDSPAAMQQLMRTAFDQGAAQGVLAGAEARAQGQAFGTRAPLLIDVVRRDWLPRGPRNPQGDCVRFEVTHRQDGVRTGAGTAPAELRFEVDWCRSGGAEGGGRLYWE